MPVLIKAFFGSLEGMGGFSFFAAGAVYIPSLKLHGEDGPPNTDGTRGGAKLYILIGISFDSEATTN
ncbi:transmembrane protein, putative [Medicago truncatula]|uniref:Transmembrane protein, putative n=1 Tax=Medicago truncatula TaxID=3880 RepID=G7K2Z1_MEDTR|nr:transmembrane protein, putative [Medicago truncatula]